MVKPLGEGAWLAVDDTYPRQIAERYKLLQKRKDYFVDRVEGDYVKVAECELRDKVVDYLLTHYPDCFRREGEDIVCPLTGMVITPAADPMVAVGLLASEDLILMMPSEVTEEGQSVYRAKSGALAFPNNWSLRSHFNEAAPPKAHTRKLQEWKENRELSREAARLGRSNAEIHNPSVKHYMKYFLHPVDNIFNRMPPNTFYWRRNWMPTMTDHLCQHPDLNQVRGRDMTPGSLEKYGYIRSEHETFVKMPESGAVVFGIKTYIWPIAEIMKRPAAFEALFVANDNLSPEMFDYRSDSLPIYAKMLNKHRPKTGPAAPGK